MDLWNQSDKASCCTFEVQIEVVKASCLKMNFFEGVDAKICNGIFIPDFISTLFSRIFIFLGTSNIFCVNSMQRIFLNKVCLKKSEHALTRPISIGYFVLKN